MIDLDYSDIEQARKLLSDFKKALVAIDTELHPKLSRDWYDMSGLYDDIRQFGLDLEAHEARLKDSCKKEEDENE